MAYLLLGLYLAKRAIDEYYRTNPVPQPLGTEREFNNETQLFYNKHDEADGMLFTHEYPWEESRFEKVKSAGYGVPTEVRLPYGPNPDSHKILDFDIVDEEYNRRYQGIKNELEIETLDWRLDPTFNSTRNVTPGAYFIVDPIGSLNDLNDSNNRRARHGYQG